MKKTTEERFWEKVDRTGECWLWTSVCYPTGYGRFMLRGKPVPAHRFSYALVNCEIPEGMYVDHRCHQHNCVRPEHLRLVTPAQNSQNRRGAQSNSVTGIRGVTWRKHSQKYQARVSLSGKTYSAGYYDTLEEAEAAVIAKRRELFTHDDYEEWAASDQSML